MPTRREFLTGSLTLAAAAALPKLAFGLPAPAAAPATRHEPPRSTDDLAFATAGEIAEAIRGRQVSSLEVVETFLERIERFNPRLNAVCTLTAEAARQRAREADRALAAGESWGPLHGVPMTVKDCFEVVGVRTTVGFPPLADYVPDEDAVAVERLRRAGAVFLGKSNVPPLVMDWRTDNPVFGRTNNPHDVERTPGGSSGGSAAVVAAGLAPLEVGSDIGGSIRVPAHFCGICGLKPTEGRVSNRGHLPPLPAFPPTIRHQNCVGPLARSVDDLELAFRVLVGDGTDWEGAPLPATPAAARTVSTLRLAWTDDFDGLPVGAAARSALAGLASELDRRGARVRRHSLGFDVVDAWETWAQLTLIELGAGVPDEVIAGFFDQLEAAAAEGAPDVPMVRGWLRMGREPATPRRYAEVLGRRDRLVAAADELFASYDALLCPVTAPSAAPRHQPPDAAVDVDGTPVSPWMAGLGLTSPFNLTGNPVVVLPMGATHEGLPIGVQIVGRRWREMELLAVARAVAKALPPAARPELAG